MTTSRSAGMPIAGDERLDDRRDLVRVELHEREGLRGDRDGHGGSAGFCGQPLAASPPASRLAWRRSRRDRPSRRRRTRPARGTGGPARSGLSSFSPRKPPSENSLSTTRWNSSARSRRSVSFSVSRRSQSRAHLHVGDLVGQHPVLAELEQRVAGDVAELLHRGEHVDGEAFEGPVDAGEAQHRIGVAGRLEQERVLGELTELGAHPVA